MYFREWLWPNSHDSCMTENQEGNRCQSERTNMLCAAALGVHTRLSVLLLRRTSRIPGRNRCHINTNVSCSTRVAMLIDFLMMLIDFLMMPVNLNVTGQEHKQLPIFWVWRITELHNFGRMLLKALLEKELNFGYYKADINRCLKKSLPISIW